ncbi:MAG: glycoside hydrolase family 127 protein [Deltaproteobacteria bacterium]|nr:glycoside hydrolase family 127 protein [Deltaproteobacteria bacterium]
MWLAQSLYVKDWHTLKLGVFARFRRPLPLEISLEETMLWLARAQDSTEDDGVAQAYFVREKLWTASYPETTGYIIPTFFDYAKLTRSRAFYDRAVRMADWETKIQLKGGGVQAGTVDAPKIVPTVFNTGMVIFGWIRAFEETGNAKYLESAVKAAGWLASIQDDDGAWRNFGSTATAYSLNTYNTRVAWALLEVHRITRDERFRDRAIKNLDWALSQQLPNGWLENNCLLDNAQPYTHTVAYAMRGFLEAGAYLRESRYLSAAERIFQALQRNIQRDGYLPGRFDRRWRPTVRYCCLTGNSQLAINGFRLSELTSNESYLAEAKKLLTFVLHTQDIKTNDPNLRGGIAGSWPVRGRYHPHQYPNWAAKFTADAVMKWMEIEAAGREQEAAGSKQQD